MKIDPEFEAFIPPLTEAEFAELEKLCVEDGHIRKPLVTWRGLLIAGHHRFKIAQKHNLPYTAEAKDDLPDREAVKAWMYREQIGQRQWSDEQRMVFAALNGYLQGREAKLDKGIKALQLADHDPERARAFVAGKGPSLLMVYNDAARDPKIEGIAPPPKRRRQYTRRSETDTPQGPSGTMHTPIVPEGHELKARSTYTKEGEERAAWDKSRIAPADAPNEDPVPEWFHLSKVSSYADSRGVVVGQWRSAIPDKARQWEAFWTAAEARAQKFEGLAPPTEAPKFSDSDLLNVYPLGDPHIGMLAWAPETEEHHDLRIAERDLIKCVDLLASVGPDSEEAILANMGDFFHAQSDAQTTPRGGHKLDVDGRRGKVLEIGLNILERLILRLLQKHQRVRFRSVAGNHDPDLNDMIGLYLSAVFRNEPRVTIDQFRNPYQYHEHGSTLLGFCHGDGAKPEKLPGVMASDKPEEWGRTRYRHWLMGHVHHISEKEHPGCRVETVRTLAGRDFWHHHAGYRSGRSLDVITFHRDYGRLGKLTVPLEMVRDRLGRPYVEDGREIAS